MISLMCYAAILLLTGVTAVKVTEHNLKDLLTHSEWTTIMGHQNPEFSLVWAQPARQKRDVGSPQTRHLILNARSLNRKFDLSLERSPELLANDFKFIARYKNRTESLPVEKHNCFYRSENAALSICEDLRGIISLGTNEFFLIHPLPNRFHTPDHKPHVITRQTDYQEPPELSNVQCAHIDSKILHGERKIWRKHRRKKNKIDDKHNIRNTTNAHRRGKRSILVPGSPIFVETAVFVDKDLYQHMRSNFPKDTERELVRFVLAMINAVQLLYHDTSLGRPVNFVLKRLEILHEEPSGLVRPHDIDRFLSSFCNWQRTQNPPGDGDPAHWDHALILTGLDLYVVSKHGKLSSQVVGLAPVAGMCTATSSCTVNEGRHFESVFVVAHEIGHNLGMRHDGPLSDNDCDPSSYIMSPTLGSGKITWSACSRRYLQKFIETKQAGCLLDHGSLAGQIDHSAEGALPGERFDADQQCMLKFGGGSKHSSQQPLDDVCRDLHCQRERYTWTSHPALEGTTCGPGQWCRGGRCVQRGVSSLLAYSMGALTVAVRVDGGWSSWQQISDCASGCLYGEEGRLRAGSTGIMVSVRRCNSPRAEGGGRPCQGTEKRYQACSASQCLNVPRMTVREFAEQICERAKKVDKDFTGKGLQKQSSNPGDACMVWCQRRNGELKNRGWTFPDGTVCQTKHHSFGRQGYCISGRCEEFECDFQNEIKYAQHPTLCPSKREDNEISWNKKSYRENSVRWISASGCHFNCMDPGSGIRLVVSKGSKTTSIQLCQPDKMGCGRLKSSFQHATTVCMKYKERVRRLSGLGMQISAAIEDPDRPCRVACQDENVSHRFYLVNGKEGWFPFGTDCSRGSSDKNAYCISGKCLEFGPDNTPSSESEFNLPLLSRTKRSLLTNSTKIIATLQQQDLDQLISQLNLTLSGAINSSFLRNNQSNYDIDLVNPVYVEINPI